MPVVIDDPTGAAAVTRYYCYDPLDRLTKVSSSSATCASGIVETNTFDDAGNRTSTTGQTFTYTTGQLTGCSPSCGTVDHDAAGRLVHYNGWYLWYDPESRLSKACTTALCTTSGNKVTFAYDGEGRRTRITSTIGAGATTTINLRYGGDAVAAETNAAGTVTRTYVTDETGAIVKVCDPDCTGTNPQYLVTWNGHGDAQALWRIESTGSLTLANSFTYSTWGTPTTATHNSIADLKFRFLYVGHYGVQWDDFGTGLGFYYMQARHYAPSLARFIQPDPEQAELNLYSYVANGPTSKIDPQGGCWWFLLPAATGIGTVAAVPSLAVCAVALAGASLFAARTAVLARDLYQDWQHHRPLAPSHSSGLQIHRVDRKLTPKEVKKLEDYLGEDAHHIKSPGGKGASRLDLWVRPNGQIIVKPKSGKGPGDPVGATLWDLNRRGGR